MLSIVFRDNAGITMMLMILHTQVILLHLRVDTAHVKLGSIFIHVGVSHLNVESGQLISFWLLSPVLKLGRIEFKASTKLVFGFLAV